MAERGAVASTAVGMGIASGKVIMDQLSVTVYIKHNTYSIYSN